MSDNTKTKSKVETAEVIKQDKVDIFNGLPEGTMRDCFVALAMAILKDSWQSTDTKIMTFDAMIWNLEKMGYSPEDIEKLKGATNKLMKTFHQPNGFMG